MAQQHMFVCITTITTDTYIYEYILYPEYYYQ